METVTLKAAARNDMQIIWKMQITAFSELLEKYRDYDMSPGAESFETVMAKYEQPWTAYYFIVAGEETVGAVRIIDRKDGSRKRISPIWIMPEQRNKGYAQAAIRAAEQIYGASHWCLDTILQEAENLHLYEKWAIVRPGKLIKSMTVWILSISKKIPNVQLPNQRNCRFLPPGKNLLFGRVFFALNRGNRLKRNGDFAII